MFKRILGSAQVNLGENTANLPELNLKLFCSDVQNNIRFSSGKFGGKHRNQQTTTCQVLAELNKIWSCLIFIKLYMEYRREGKLFQIK